MNLKTERPKVNVAEVRAAVESRSAGMCEARVSDECRESTRRYGHPLPGAQMHHRKLRKQGGKDDEPTLVHVCLWCHTWVHAHVAVSYRMGLLIRGSDSDPVEPYTRREMTPDA